MKSFQVNMPNKQFSSLEKGTTTNDDDGGANCRNAVRQRLTGLRPQKPLDKNILTI